MLTIFARKHATDFFLIACFLCCLVAVVGLLWLLASIFAANSLAFWVASAFTFVLAMGRLLRSLQFRCRTGIVDIVHESHLRELIEKRSLDLGISAPDRVIVDLSDEIAISYVTNHLLRAPELQLRVGCLCLMILDEKDIDSLISHELGHVRLRPNFRFASWMRYLNLAILRAWFPWFVVSFEKMLMDISEVPKRVEELDCDSVAAQCTSPLSVSRALLAHAVLGYVYECRVLEREEGMLTKDLFVACQNASEVCKGLNLCRQDQFLQEFLAFETKQSVWGHHPALLDRFQNLGISTEDAIWSFCTREFHAAVSEPSVNKYFMKKLEVWTS
jgi:hypothetical protein